MKRWVFRLLVLMALLNVAATVTAFGGLVCDDPVYDFGVLPDSEQVKHTFVVRNTSAETIRIGGVRTTCGCTLANITGMVIPPGGESAVDAVFVLKGRLGPQEKPIHVNAANPADGTLELMIRGVVTREIYLEKDVLHFGAIGAEHRDPLTARIGSEGDQWRLVGVDAAGKSFKVDISDDGREAMVSLLPGAKPGIVRERLRLLTDHPEGHRLPLEVVAVVEGDYTVVPASIRLPAASSDPLRRAVLVRPGAVKALAVTAVTPPDGLMQVNVRTLGNGTLSIVIDNIYVDSVRGKALRLETDAGEIVIPFEVGS